MEYIKLFEEFINENSEVDDLVKDWINMDIEDPGNEERDIEEFINGGNFKQLAKLLHKSIDKQVKDKNARDEYHAAMELLIGESAQYAEYIVEMATPKDLKRINDLIASAGGDEAKEMMLANKMAKLIKNKAKGLTRYEAALDILGKDHEVTKILGRKAQELGNKVDLDAEPVVKDTLGKLGSQIPGTKAKASDKDKGRIGRGYPSMYDTSILPIGSTNLATGKCKYFNIYDTWGKGKDSTIELWRVPARYTRKGKDAYKFIITSGSKGLSKIGASDSFQHDQTQRWMFNAELVDWANIGDADLLMKAYGVKAAPGYVYK